MTTFQDLNLIDPLLKAVDEMGYSEPTSIQALAIPAILSGQDVQAMAQTGTGKTAGFTLPLLQHLSRFASSSMSPAKHPVRALILTPTRELAIQVEESVKNYSKYLTLRSCAIYGGVNIQDQIKLLQGGIEVVIATPGRLMDHVNQKTIQLSQVSIFVLDEADRMLDMGFIPDIKKIIQLLPTQRQNLMFSATFSDEINKLAKGFLNQPVQVQATQRNTTASSIVEIFYGISEHRKKDLLVDLFLGTKSSQAIVFTNTKLDASKLSQAILREGLKCDALHGDRSQRERIEILDKFKSGEIELLIATDVAARGLDIDSLPLVFNFDLPSVAEDYIHRIGRTGRAGSPGQAISFVSESDRRLLAAIEKVTNTRYELRSGESILNKHQKSTNETSSFYTKSHSSYLISDSKKEKEIPALLRKPVNN
ncbi:DEAD/DEAH box helicase [Ferrovum sp. PN-J185]|uniref:DEAD/DEAH box helicase n=1 Tax=Ferrovum sp. PN-J185 TaxID=1356306 RepID=UPI00079CCA6C|nr:DEAD/DEAH box helicase [Ferrovum sp. PN-J185]KXW56896.1 ATP-dependent RNA helicase RhlE [Ferrovum sp. PN-J185]MCC6069236.1 DEAD/DEAH box helicase [Ferrovum sp. PN-J185]